MIKLNIENEYNELNKVVIAPVASRYLKQQRQLIKILNKYNVQIFKTKKCDDAKYQMFVRDPFVVIGNKILLCYMKENFRRLELNTINEIIQDLDESSKIVLDNDVFVEGGDVIIHNDIIFVGQHGNRTNKKGFEFLKKNFETNYRVIPLYMINPNKNITWIHLDCLFSPLSDDTAIIYEDGFEEKSLEILKTEFPNLITVNKREQEELATNIINLGNKTIIMQERHNRLIEIALKFDFNVEVMDMYDTINELGYNRCLTCPLERK